MNAVKTETLSILRSYSRREGHKRHKKHKKEIRFVPLVPFVAIPPLTHYLSTTTFADGTVNLIKLPSASVVA